MPLFVEWMRRKPGTTQEEFTAYWSERHAPIVRDRTEVRSSLMADSYTHYRTRPADQLNAEMLTARGLGVASYDGICIPRSTKVTIDDYTDALSDLAGPTAVAWGTLLEDEVNFMDMVTSIPCFADEEVVIESADEVAAYVIVCLRRSASVSPEAFLDFKRTTFADRVETLREALGLAEYRQVASLESPLNEGFRAVRGCEEAHYDFMDMIGFASREDLAESWATARDAWQDLARLDDGMVDLAGSSLVVADKVVIFDDLFAPQPTV